MKKTGLSYVISIAFILLFIGLKSEFIYSQTIDDTEWIACNVYEDTTYLRFENNNIYFKSPELEGFEGCSSFHVFNLGRHAFLE